MKHRSRSYETKNMLQATLLVADHPSRASSGSHNKTSVGTVLKRQLWVKWCVLAGPPVPKLTFKI
jgi:hypothetical protein